jgi:hypothetical protein
MPRMNLEPGQVLHDPAGHETVLCIAPSSDMIVFTPSAEVFRKAMAGEIPIQAYVGAVIGHEATLAAYYSDRKLPSGAYITEDPDIIMPTQG